MMKQHHLPPMSDAEKAAINKALSVFSGPGSRFGALSENDGNAIITYRHKMRIDTPLAPEQKERLFRLAEKYKPVVQVEDHADDVEPAPAP